MALVLEQATTLLRTIIRSIDKKVDYSFATVEGDRPGILVNLALRKRTTAVTIPATDLEAAGESTMRRDQVRAVLKRAIDGMMFESAPVASTKMLRAKVDPAGFFRPPQGGGGRGGRR